MEVYSETIFSFVAKCEKMIKDIISKETPYKQGRTRVEINKRLYPLSICIFCESKNLGYFDPNTYRIGLNQSLVYTVKDDVLKNILRHELAHFFSYVLYNNIDTPHGHIFKEVCQDLNWNEDVSKASLDIEAANIKEGNLRSEKVIEKVKNLLELSKSDNEHEAALATQKANQLLLKHNLQNIEGDDDFTYVDCVYFAKRSNAKIDALYKILSHFMLKPLIVQKKDHTAIEVTGRKENIELAHYICEFLDREFERLWLKRVELKGLRAKNSFISGLSLGLCQKLNDNKENLSQNEKYALVLHEKKLEDIQRRVHKRLSSTSKTRQVDKGALLKGQKDGKNLNIHRAIKSKTKTKLLSWR